jgi:multidrug resistance protein MdtO
MAPRVIEPPAGDALRSLPRLLAPRPGRLAFSTRIGIMCALTVLVAEIYQTPEPALAAYIVFFLNEKDRTKSLIMNIVLLLLITLIIGFIILVAMAVMDDPMWRVTSMTVISFFLLFLASASKLRPIGGTIALIVGYALDELGLIPVGELGTRALLYAWLFVGIPAAASMVVNLLIAPSPRRLAERAIAQRLGLCAAMLRAPDARTRERFEECLREGGTEIEEWLALAEREKTSPAGDIAALRHSAGSAVVLQSAIDVLDRSSEALLSQSLRAGLAGLLDDMAATLSAGSHPIEITWDLPDDRETPTPLAAELLVVIKDAVVRFAERPDTVSGHREAPKEAGGFFVSDAFTNPEHVHYALKTTAAAMFCYVLYSLLDWPGIHTCFITCYIVSLGTTAESVEKLTLRILGCAVGAAAGTAALIFLIPSLTSIGALMIVVFLGATAAAYVVAGGPRISYAGFQIAFAFFLCVVQGAGPAFDMATARDRVIGILLGNLVTYLVLTNFWPVSVGERIDPAIAALLRNLDAMLRAASPAARRALAFRSQSALAAVDADITLAGYEPANVRPPQDWLAVRHGAARELRALEGPLLLAAEQYAAASASIADRIEALADRLAAPEAVPAAPAERVRGEWNMLPLYNMIDGRLRRLEESLTGQAVQGSNG